jgi:hypothetical protein
MAGRCPQVPSPGRVLPLQVGDAAARCGANNVGGTKGSFSALSMSPAPPPRADALRPTPGVVRLRGGQSASGAVKKRRTAAPMRISAGIARRTRHGPQPAHAPQVPAEHGHEERLVGPVSGLLQRRAASRQIHRRVHPRHRSAIAPPRHVPPSAAPCCPPSENPMAARGRGKPAPSSARAGPSPRPRSARRWRGCGSAPPSLRSCGGSCAPRAAAAQARPPPCASVAGLGRAAHPVQEEHRSPPRRRRPRYLEAHLGPGSTGTHQGSDAIGGTPSGRTKRRTVSSGPSAGEPRAPPAASRRPPGGAPADQRAQRQAGTRSTTSRGVGVARRQHLAHQTLLAELLPAGFTASVTPSLKRRRRSPRSMLHAALGEAHVGAGCPDRPRPLQPLHSPERRISIGGLCPALQ